MLADQVSRQFKSEAQAQEDRGALISVIVPTYNERDNLRHLVLAIAASLVNVRWEIIIVDDDSPDGTAAAARAIYADDQRVRVIRRIGRRGLASACVEGMLASSAPFVAVIDADLQHDPALLASMLRRLANDEADIVIASRYVAGGDIGDWTAQRTTGSRLATRLAHAVTGVKVRDPMSGYFMLRREIIDEHAHALSAVGFKILLDILVTAGEQVRVVEVPLRFGQRLHGESKMSAAVTWDYLLLLADKAAGGRIPVRFIAFCTIGLTGVGIHFLVLVTLLKILGMAFVAAQAIATSVSIISNFTINNLLTYADRRLRGWRWFSGLGSFALICGFGALANVGVAAWLFGHQVGWPLAAVAGIAASAVWNYGVSARYTWGASNGS
ncbi:MAG: glycosyltransferase family 2 protein [Sphingomicrobium sp.]